jgi:hypothetical protein
MSNSFEDAVECLRKKLIEYHTKHIYNVEVSDQVEVKLAIDTLSITASIIVNGNIYTTQSWIFFCRDVNEIIEVYQD